MPRTLFHVTRNPAAILAAGFVNGDGTDGLGAGEQIGVLLTGRPRIPAYGGHVLAVTFPDVVDLTDYVTGAAADTWCVPAKVVNSTAKTMQLSPAEVRTLTTGQQR